METTLDWAAAGKIKPVIDKIFPLEQTPEAFAALRKREVLGKLLVVP
jgi:NADPH:quinone reductase-like Zn-dependent oxidoreductase